jgi:hypothetical protein
MQGFLGTLGTIHIFIQNFSTIAQLLIKLTKKRVEFWFGEEERAIMNELKDLAKNSPYIHTIDYSSTNEVILGIDTSKITVGYILLQLEDDSK